MKLEGGDRQKNKSSNEMFDNGYLFIFLALGTFVKFHSSIMYLFLSEMALGLLQVQESNLQHIRIGIKPTNQKTLAMIT